jgi:hypothetical protein
MEESLRSRAWTSPGRKNFQSVTNISETGVKVDLLTMPTRTMISRQPADPRRTSHFVILTLL